MHTKRIGKRPKSLEQGHIFSLAGLSFPDPPGEPLAFRDFYPQVDITNVRKGVVVTQSCDLENRKAPYITVGLLEPFNKQPEVFCSKGFFDDCFPEFDGVVFWNEETLQLGLAKELKELIQNRTEGNPYYVFLALKYRSREQYSYLNLTKLFPIRLAHYDRLLAKVTHRVVDDFQHLIGWKMAALYGRVGVNDYGPSDVERIVKTLSSIASKELQSWVTRERGPAKPVYVADESQFKGIRTSLRQLPNISQPDKRTRHLERLTEMIAEATK